MANTNIYLKLGDLKGESLDKEHDQWIEVESFSWGVDNPASFSIGQGGQSTQAHISSINVAKYCDASSVTLFKASTTGQHIPTGTIHCLKLDGQDRKKYLIIELEDIVVSGLQWSGSGSESGLHEHLSLAFARFRQTYNLQTDKGDLGGGTNFGYDIQKSDPNF
jgi:type VI secretion system secreted protein Hcp